MPGTFIISIDFELHWGVYDTRSLSEYGKNLLGVRQAMPGMLDLFDKYDVKVTFATVGLLMFGDKKSLLERLPKRVPSYDNDSLSPYKKMESLLGENEASDKYHFGKQLVGLILDRKKHEIGSHTFCHYYCLEKGQTIFEFKEDLAAFEAVAADYLIKPVSLVFPRNQMRYNYVKLLAKHGYTNYRGNENSWVYKPHSKHGESILRRVTRFLDSYLNLTGDHCHDEVEIASEYPFNIKSSRFLRPYTPALSLLEPLKVRRVINSMELAAQQNKMYHLWWHPHNFGANTKKNLEILEKILIHYSNLRDKYGFANYTMGGYSEFLNKTYYESNTLGKGTSQAASR